MFSGQASIQTWLTHFPLKHVLCKSGVPTFRLGNASWGIQARTSILKASNSSAAAAAAAAKSLQSCPTLCDTTDSSPPGSPVPGILQARTLEWGAIAFSYLHSYMDRIFILNASTLNKLFCCFHKGPIKQLLLGCYSVRVGWTQWKNHSQYSGTTQ